MLCVECREEKEIVAKGLCSRCYGLMVEKEKSAICKGCKEFKPIKSKGLCRKCYARFQRHGDTSWERKKKGDKLCSHCRKRPVHAKGFCGPCYARYLKNGKPDRIKVKVERECSFCGKVDFLKAKGLCSNCYSRFLKTGSPKYTQIKNVAICGFCGEEKEIAGKGLCASCYQRAWKNGTPEYKKIRNICSIDGCNEFVKSSGLCEKHYKRWKRHGHTKQTRPKGWGSKEKHPLYQTWCWQKRSSKAVLADEWKDFWQFVEDVGERPSSAHRFCVIDSLKPVYKDNYKWEQWEEGRGTDREKRNQYMKQWRQDNPEKVKDASLKKQFGITIDDYHKMLEQQNYLCAICGNGETAINPRTKIAFDLAVDHCHETGKVRALLCKNCNNMLGYVNDSPKLLIKAINYLDEHNH